MPPQDASLKILVADDDAVTRTVLKRHFASWGYRTILCKSGTEAWRILRREKVPLAVLDWMMPGIQGPELVRKIRSLKNSGYTYLILLSSRSERRDLLTGLSSG
ncbi:MAG: response regulator transcription factor, partial [Candidatus Aminicenantes bacterium]|nr:response regulator transcription factor [Candidatus Aminicenantes bacterium]